MAERRTDREPLARRALGHRPRGQRPNGRHLPKMPLTHRSRVPCWVLLWLGVTTIADFVQMQIIIAMIGSDTATGASGAAAVVEAQHSSLIDLLERIPSGLVWVVSNLDSFVTVAGGIGLAIYVFREASQGRRVRRRMDRMREEDEEFEARDYQERPNRRDEGG